MSDTSTTPIRSIPISVVAGAPEKKLGNDKIALNGHLYDPG
jgi:lipoic acid synthetase